MGSVSKEDGPFHHLGSASGSRLLRSQVVITNLFAMSSFEFRQGPSLA